MRKLKRTMRLRLRMTTWTSLSLPSSSPLCLAPMSTRMSLLHCQASCRPCVTRSSPLDKHQLAERYNSSRSLIISELTLVFCYPTVNLIHSSFPSKTSMNSSINPLYFSSQLAICIFVDFIEHVNGINLPLFGPALQAMLAFCNDEHYNVRQPSAYGLGLCATICPSETFAPILEPVCRSLGAMVAAPNSHEEVRI